MTNSDISKLFNLQLNHSANLRKTNYKDRIKKIREEAELEGMFETGDKRIPLQKVNKPFHSKKPFLSSFTPGNAKKLAKRKRNV